MHTEIDIFIYIFAGNKKRIVNRSIGLYEIPDIHAKDKNGSHKLIHVLCTVKYVFTFILCTNIHTHTNTPYFPYS